MAGSFCLMNNACWKFQTFSASGGGGGLVIWEGIWSFGHSGGNLVIWTFGWEFGPLVIWSLGREFWSFHFFKAYNRQNHNIHITKLSDLQVPGWLLNLVMGYLKNREMVMRYNNKTSPSRSLPGGGPQGGLFNLPKNMEKIVVNSDRDSAPSFNTGLLLARLQSTAVQSGQNYSQTLMYILASFCPDHNKQLSNRGWLLQYYSQTRHV